jgi:anaerobic magnesium-protoporphyrin IX monomethyl ester cyclase
MDVSESVKAVPPPSEAERQARGHSLIALIGYQDQGNLGMGYLAAVLIRHGYQVEMIDIRDGSEAIAEKLVAKRPLVVGFSLIFQFFLPQFRNLAIYLREVGIVSHFTIGGHYPSLCHDELLASFPEIDSVVRYEGEETLIDLVDHIHAGKDWRDIHGLAYIAADEIVATEPRPLVPDLDSLPFPIRSFEPERIAGFTTMPLLASRGCIRRCSFCSIHTFYRTAPGKVVRVRKPEKVIEEMQHLYRRHGARIFLFQDDDFPLWGQKGRRWVDEIIARMHDSGLAEKTIWKISCRAEYIETELFEAMREAGLFLVYMGIESGVDSGLEVLFKQMTIEQNLEAVRSLKRLGVVFAYGFMLFDPSSTFESVRQNIGFLRRIVGDGSAAAVFSRMLPYGGTPIRDLLAKEGRLRGDLTHPDYDFLDLRLNEYNRLLTKAVRPWIHNQGLSYSLNDAADELETINRLSPGATGNAAYRSDLLALTAECNAKLFRLVEESSLAFERNDLSPLDPRPISEYCERMRSRLFAMREAFITANVDALMENIIADRASGPILTPQIH